MRPRPSAWWRIGNVPIWDWLFILAGISGALYIGVTWYEISFEFLGQKFRLQEQVLRQGNPETIDIVFGTILIVVLLEAVRRTLGIVVPIIILLFTAFAVSANTCRCKFSNTPALAGPSTSTICTSRPRGFSASRCGLSRRSSFSSFCSGCWPNAWGSVSFSSTSRPLSPAATPAAWRRSALSPRPSSGPFRDRRSPTPCRPAR